MAQREFGPSTIKAAAFTGTNLVSFISIITNAKYSAVLDHSSIIITIPSNSLFYGCSATPHCVSRCVCSPTVPIHGWEGPCQLPDGAHIKVGCHSFSFRTNPEFTWTPELVIPSDRVLHDDTLEFLS